jgi:hypothetical protein
VGRGGEVLIAAAAAAAMGQYDAIIRALEVVDQLAGGFVVNDRADRDLQDDIFALAASAVRAFAVAAALGLVLRVVAKMDQSVVALAGFDDDVSAAAAISAGRAAARNKLLAAKGHAAVSAVAGLDLDSCLIDEHACE